MRQSVRDAFYSFNAPMEGVVRHFYADIKQLVTIGVGNLVDPVIYAIQLPMRRRDGSLATRDEIVADWARVKNDASMARLGHRAAAMVTQLHLNDEDLTELVAKKADEMEKHLVRRFPKFGEWCADAQLATLSLSWACGPAFNFPRLSACLQAQDWAGAATHCNMNEAGNPGLRPRNIANKKLYRNAAQVVTKALDPEVLYFPRDLVAEPTTETELPNPPSEPTRILHPMPEFPRPSEE